MFFSHAVLPSQTSRIPDETKKILGQKINPPPHPTATKFPSPEIFREGLNDTARHKMESNCM